MTSELMRLFSEGGGRESLTRGAIVRPGAPARVSSPPGATVASALASVEGQVAMELAMAEKQSAPDQNFSHIMLRASEFLRSWDGDEEAAVSLLLNASDRLKDRYGVSPWEAYWTLLHRAFRTDVSPLQLTSSLVRELERDAA